MNLDAHPCFNKEVKHKFGRVHLPVAPKCNIKCNYCNRKYDCLNESRPGVTSAVLSPLQAVDYLEKVLIKEPRITVAGIAGPGDPFANPEETMETLRLINKQFPNIILCLATNGMGLLPYIDELSGLNLTHITITVNALDPVIGGKIYSWARDGKVLYRKEKAAAKLIERQLESIKKLKEKNITVKINSIIVPGINDEHIIEIAKEMGHLKVDMMNAIAMFPSPGSEFETMKEPDKDFVSRIREEAGKYVSQMKHCTRCRADAVGLLGEDRIGEFSGCLSACSSISKNDNENKPYVAVASMEGTLVNLHLGEADRFMIYEKNEEGYKLIDIRNAPDIGGGDDRWNRLKDTIKDCRAILISALGNRPKQILELAGILPVEMQGFIDDGLDAVFEGGDLSKFKSRNFSSKGCGGTGMGCG
ncbi:MAG: radical SAM protein [Desulfobacterium sp.]|nr:radical SAM protein [Desulfobacterium sp.]MBU3948365.1 radical SAM protein [Pseudomonadota bacterium]MBU4036197.1 radical SAM protein [Pseudomonadota bacterium]